MPFTVDWSDRRTIAVIGGTVVGAFVLAVVLAVGTSNVGLGIKLGALAAAPAVIAAAMRWPYVVPYALYAMLVPFDDVLALPGGGTVTKLLGLASAFVIAVHVVRTRRISPPPLALYFFGSLLLWVLIEALRSPDLSEAMKTTQTLVALLALYAVLSVAPIDERSLRTVCAAIVLGGVLASLYGLEMFRTHPEFVAHDEGRLTLNMFGRTMDANGFADSLLGPLALALVATLNSRSFRKRVVSGGALAIIGTAVVASQSREALLAVLAILSVAIWFSRRRIVGFISGAVGTAIVIAAVPTIGQRFVSGVSSGGAGRTSIWHVDWLAFMQHPIIGWGTGGSIEAYNRNYLAVYQLINAGWSRPPHNTFLFLAVEFGAIGALLFYCGWFTAFRCFAGVGRGDSLYDLRVGLTGGFAALLIAGVFVDVTAFKNLWLLLAAAAQFRTVALARRAQTPPVVYYYEAAGETSGAGAAALRPMLRNGNSR